MTAWPARRCVPMGGCGSSAPLRSAPCWEGWLPAPAAALSLLPGGQRQEVDESQLHCASSFCPMGVSPSAYQVLLGGLPCFPRHSRGSGWAPFPQFLCFFTLKAPTATKGASTAEIRQRAAARLEQLTLQAGAHSPACSHRQADAASTPQPGSRCHHRGSQPAQNLAANEDAPIAS